MRHYVVDISNVSDERLELFGWINTGQEGLFTKYWNPAYNEFQTVSNFGRRTLILDDISEVRQLGARLITVFDV